VIDRQIRRVLAPPLDRAGAALARAGISPVVLTATGWAFGVAACVALSQRWWTLALVGWLANRVLDGLDGPLARARGATELGGYLDIVADFSVYGGFVLGLAVAEPRARFACVVLLVAYYVSGTAFLALSSLMERRRVTGADERSLRFVGGLAEGAETIVVYALLCLFPAEAAGIAWGFAAAVGITAGQRVVAGARCLAAPAAAPACGPGPCPPSRPESAARPGPAVRSDAPAAVPAEGR
jgi:phosphatidylglycerophosphate synthase